MAQTGSYSLPPGLSAEGVSIPGLSQDALEERLLEARKTYKLNMGYCGITQLPPSFIPLLKRYNPHITELELSSNNLAELPDELEDFRYLRILRLKYNVFKKVPSVVTRLPQLMLLELSGNQLTKVEDSIGALQLLKELDLSGNLLTSLSDALGELPKLEVLQLENNRLEGLPENIGDLPSLIKLDISTNSLRFLPASMGHFKRIQRVDCTNNRLARVPPSMGHLKTLKELNLRYNNLDDRYKMKVEEGLSKLLAFLREEEERERLEEIERLKPIGTPVGSYFEYRCKAEVGQVLKTELGDVTVDNRCWIRSGHSLTQVGNMLVVYGGTLLKDGSTTSDVFWMTMDRMEWHHQICKGEKPVPRYNHLAVFDEESHRLVVFGGRTAERKRLNDVLFLDLDSFTWYKCSCEGAAPTPREQAVATFWAGSMIVFGGHAIGGRTNDLFLLDLTSWQWTQPATAGTAPSPRQACALCIGHGNLLFVHGGRNNFVLEDLHVLDFVNKTWCEISCVGRMPPPRHGHLISVHKDQLYLFGGLDELGAQSFTMYRLGLPPGENYNMTRPEWAEWDSELPYNKNRSCTLFKGALSIYQLGSNTLGRSSDEDAEKGLVFWDVFKTTRLDSLKPRVLDEEELKPKNAKRMRVQHTVHIASKMPRSFSVHSLPESKALAYVQDFQRTFEELYPHRRPLYLTPKNECNIPKFVCTTVRPTQLSYTELYDLDGCANFVADFLAYEALEDALHPPEHLPSSMSVLNWQAGDCFDLALVLASLLIGVGFNAYVVVGYAPSAVTLNDQTKTECPVLEREKRGGAPLKEVPRPPLHTTTSVHRASEQGAAAGAPGAAAAAAAAAGAKPGAKTKYHVRPSLSLESKFLKAQADKLDKTPVAGSERGDSRSSGRDPHSNAGHSNGGKSVAAGSAREAAAGLKSVGSKSFVDDDLTDRGGGGSVDGDSHAGDGQDGSRSDRTMNGAGTGPAAGKAASTTSGPCKTVHAWVLVMAGKRDVPENVFMEPTTGRKYSIAESPYQGIEYMFNHRNFWVCMQLPEPHSDSRADPREVSFDLLDPSRWEGVFEDRNRRSPSDQAFGDDSDLRTLSSPNSILSQRNVGMMSGGSHKPKSPSIAGMASRNNHGGGTFSQKSLARARAGGNSVVGLTNGDGNTPPRTSESVYAESAYSEDDGPTEQEFVPDVPPSWVPKLSIPRDAFDMKCPRGSKLALYNCAQHEIFALFGDCSRWDGMVERLVLYDDDERTVVSEIRERFQRRRDKLRERRVCPQRDTTAEYFDGGSSFGLKDILTVKNEKRVLSFYHTARLDGLVRREELEGRKIIETFLGRDDRLMYRSASYTPAAEAEVADDPFEDDTSRRRKAHKGKEAKKQLPIHKMTEKFVRQVGTDADADVAKRGYYLFEARLRVDYHFGENRITNSSRTFHKDGQSQIVQVDPLVERPKPGALLEEYQALLQSEKDCVQAIRDSEWEISEIVRTRTNQEQNITLETPYYDIVRIKAEESEEEEEETAEAAYDYLSPFLPAVVGLSSYSRDQALDIREKCLKALKDRLIERANIIQARLDEEAASLAKRQQNFNRDRDQMTQEEEEEYERAVEESMFRINILEKRLKRHEEQALHKYYQLDAKLRSDSRLSSLLT